MTKTTIAVTPSAIDGILSNLKSMTPNTTFLLPRMLSAAGDIWMTWLLTKENPKSMVLDHPSEAGFYIIDKREMNDNLTRLTLCAHYSRPCFLRI